MEPADLVGFVIRLHEKRVQVHKAYDDAFHAALDTKVPTGDATLPRDHQQVVNAARGRFKELSEAVEAAATALEAIATTQIPSADDSSIEITIESAGALVRSLQNLQQKRVQLVSKHHLEQSKTKGKSLLSDANP